MSAANTFDCFRECVGKRVIGVFKANGGDKILVFDDKTGLAFTDNGAFWRMCPADVERELAPVRERLEATQKDISDVLRIAGFPPGISTAEGGRWRGVT